MSEIASNVSPESSDREADQKVGLMGLGRLVPFLKPYVWQILAAGTALVLAAGTVLFFGQGLRRLVDTGFATSSFSGLNQSLMLIFLTVLLLSAATFARFYTVSWLGERLVADIRKAVYAKLLEQSAWFYETNKVGELTSRITTDTTIIQTVVGSSASMALRNGWLAIGGIIMLLITSLKLSAVLFLVLPTVLIPIIFFGRRVRHLSKQSQTRLAEVSARSEQDLSAIKTVQANTREAHNKHHFSESVEWAFSDSIARVRARAFLTATVMVLVFGATCLMFWVGGRDVIGGQMTAGRLTEFVFYAIVVAGAFGALSEVLGDLQRAAGASERLIELLNLVPQIRSPEGAKERTQVPAKEAPKITFDQVTFAYPARPNEAILKGLSFDLMPGESLAIVGSSGAGKSTLFELLLRFYDLNQGQIQLEGQDIRQMNLQDLRRHFAWVSQDVTIFAGTLAENIAFGRPDTSRADLEAAADAAQVMAFAKDLPDGLNCFVGEQGVRLSGGQRQRVALARALLRDAPVLLLDEATSALDVESEGLIQAALDQAMEDKTAFIIAHRFSTIMGADRVLVLEKGEIKQLGRPTDLLQEEGTFKRLAQLQNLER